jgi:hypothetical protein
MTCKPFAGWIRDSVHESLDPKREAELKAHLGTIDRALMECFDHEPHPAFVARVRLRLREEREASRLPERLITRTWLPASAIAALVLAVFLFTIWTLNWHAPFRRIAVTLSCTNHAAIPSIDGRLTPQYQTPTDVPQIGGQNPSHPPSRADNRKTRILQRTAPDTQVLAPPGRWAAIVQLSRAAQPGSVIKGSEAVETMKVRGPAEINEVVIEPVRLQDVEIEPVKVQEVEIEPVKVQDVEIKAVVVRGVVIKTDL